MLRQQASIFNIHSKIFMFEIMGSRVLAILLSTFPVMAFITEKATGIIATQLRLPCKRDKGKNAVILGLSKKQTKWLSKMNINSYD